MKEVRFARIMGLETWTAEQEPGADEQDQSGVEEVALERKKHFEAVCPLLLKLGKVLETANAGRT